jgi:hypothetical protein
VEAIDLGALPARHSVSVAGVIVDDNGRALLSRRMARGVIALVFRCRILAGQLTANDEVTEFQWATADEVTRMVSEAYAARVLDALQDTAIPAVRQHDGVHLIS